MGASIRMVGASIHTRGGTSVGQACCWVIVESACVYLLGGGWQHTLTLRWAQAYILLGVCGCVVAGATTPGAASKLGPPNVLWEVPTTLTNVTGAHHCVLPMHRWCLWLGRACEFNGGGVGWGAKRLLAATTHQERGCNLSLGEWRGTPPKQHKHCCSNTYTSLVSLCVGT